jgi:predicted transcriptional regulator
LLIEETIFDIAYLKEISFILLGSLITSLGKTAYHSKLQREYSKNCELIKQTITQNPGISLRGISRSTGLAMGSTQYWIRFLEQDNEIDSKLLGKSKHYFDCHQKLSNKAILLCCLTQNSRIKEILDTLIQYPELSTQKELCQYLGYNKSLLSYYIKILKNHTILHPEMKNLTISDDFKLFLLNLDYSSS